MKQNVYVIGTVLVAAIVLVAGVSQSSTTKDRTASNTPVKLVKKQSAEASARPDTLPLIVIMLNIEKEMKSISSGLWRHNFDRIEKSARRIANHAKIPKPQIKTVKSILGDTQFKAFVRDDKTVHTMASKLSDAAAAEDFGQTAKFYQRLEQGCISCHQKHRTTIRNSPKW